MGNDKRKRTKQTPDTDNSDFDENSQPPTTSTNDTSPQHFPRFILVESKQEGREITSLSPFLIQKVIQSIAGSGGTSVGNHNRSSVGIGCCCRCESSDYNRFLNSSLWHACFTVYPCEIYVLLLLECSNFRICFLYMHPLVLTTSALC